MHASNPNGVPAHWPAALASLRTAWRAVEAAAAGQRAEADAARIAGWTDALGRLRARQAELVAAGEWDTDGPRDLLTIAGLGRRETLHTAILAWLLSAAPEHGLGAALLDAALAAAGQPRADPAEHARVRVTVEETREDRRADIVVRLPGRTVVIEAKVDAEESPAQCDDLYRLWREEPDPCFVFLTPRGLPPRTASGEAALAWRTLSFHALRDALAGLVETPTARLARGSAAVRTYQHALEAQFPRSPTVDMDARLRFYFENKALLDEWARLADDARGAADRFFRTLREPLAELATSLGPDVRLHPYVDTPWPKLVLARNSWLDATGAPRVGVGFEWNKNGAAFEKGYAGVWVNRPNPAVAVPLYTRVCAQVDALKLPKEQARTAWWPWWAYIAPEGEAWWLDLPAFRARIVERVASRWEMFAPAVDTAVPGEG